MNYPMVSAKRKLRRDLLDLRNHDIPFSKDALNPYFCKCNSPTKSNIGDTVPSEMNELFIDLSENTLQPTQIECNVLNLGMKFVVTPNVFDLREEISNLGAFANKLKGTLNKNVEDNIVNHQKKRINDTINAISQEVIDAKYDEMEIKQNLTIEEKKAIKSLQGRENIVYKKADKSNQIVVMKESDYVEKVERLLSDESTYQILDRDITPELEERTYAHIQKAYLDGKISKTICDGLLPTNSIAGKFNGLIKVHKEGNPVRPVISQINTVSRNLSEFIDMKLKPYIEKMSSYRKDTIGVLNYLNEINDSQILNKREQMILLTSDIESFYTNVSLKQAQESIGAVLKRHKHDVKESEFIIKSLKIIYETNNFTFNNRHYIQISGMSMGSPCAPNVCSLTFFVYEEQFLKDNPKFIGWIRHVDDIFSVFRGNTRQALVALKELERTSNLKLKTEMSKTEVNFLDITIHFDKHKVIQTSVYRHPAKVPVFTHAKTNQPNHSIKSTIKSHCIRYRRICSTLAGYDKVTKVLSIQLQNRGHSKQLIENIVKTVRNLSRRELLLRKPTVINDSNTSQSSYIPRLTLTHIPHITHEIKSIVRNHWSKIDDLFKFQLGFSDRNFLTVEDLLFKKCGYPRKNQYWRVDSNNEEFRINDCISVNKCEKRSCVCCQNHLVKLGDGNIENIIHINGWALEISSRDVACSMDNVIYLFSCTICHQSHYVGETSQAISGRTYGHRARNSVLNEHFSPDGHNLDLNAKVLILCNYKKLCNFYYRKGYEYFYLQILKPTLNRDFSPP